MINFGAYYILSNEVQARWERTLSLQRKLWPDWSMIKKVFVVDRTYRFTETLHQLGDIVRIDLFDSKRHILFSRAKNEGLRWGERSAIDWLLDADADAVVVRPPSTIPGTPYSSMLCHFQTDRESASDLEAKAASGRLEERHFSRFLLSREIFSRFKFDEEFYGYGGEDVDFHLNLLRNGISWSDCGLRGINLHHPLGWRLGNIERLSQKNKGAV